MFRLLLLLSLLGLAGMSLPKKPIAIYMAGDSTMANKPNKEHPERGWGMLLGEYFNDRVTIENFARNGRSTRSFLSEGLWQQIMNKVQRGDYVLIQFGHNDMSKNKGERYTTPDEYRANLVRFVKETRAKRARPVLCTQVMRRRFDEKGTFYDTHGEYPDVVRQVADSLQVPLVDMHRKSEKIIVAHGEADSKKIFLHYEPGEHPVLPNGLEDNTHFSEYGARLIAGTFVEGIRELKLPLVKYLKSEVGSGK